MKSNRHILLASVYNPLEPGAWSGTPFELRRALERHVERVTVLSDLAPVNSTWQSLLHWIFGSARYPRELVKSALDGYAEALREAVDELRPDAVIGISSHFLVHCPNAFFQRVPTVMITDSPWEFWQEEYSQFESRPFHADWFGRLDSELPNRIAATIYATDVAKNWNIARCGVSPEKVHVVPFGANWTPSEPVSKTVGESDAPMRLLFIGKDWHRKGGERAVAVARALRARGRDALLSIVGCTRDIAKADQPFVTIHGRLEADNPQHRLQMDALFRESHFLLTPTRAECFGIVFAEAGAYSMPAVGSAVHAVPTIIRDGENGFLIEEKDTPEAIAAKIDACYSDRETYERMAAAGRRRFETEFNWDTFTKRLLAIMDEVAWPNDAAARPA